MSFKLNLSGLDKFQKDLNKKVEQFNSKPKTFADIFNNSFMNTYTNFSSINDFFNHSGFLINSKKDLENINNEDLDKYVASNTSFKTWNEMYETAVKLYTKNELF